MLLALAQLAALVAVMAAFHLLEYCISKRNHPEATSAASTLLTIPFLFAFSFGVAEFLLESSLFGPAKVSVSSPQMWLGLGVTLVGLAIRSAAELTAGKSFTHHIAVTRVQQHTLVTGGIYSVIRHPGYFGMFVFAVGTQLFLRNPISVVVFAAVLWKFFSDRIEEEETALVAMFGRDYVEYRGRTRTWFPFIP